MKTLPRVQPMLCSYPRRFLGGTQTAAHAHAFFEVALALEDGAEWHVATRKKPIRLPRQHWLLIPPHAIHHEQFQEMTAPSIGWIGFALPPGEPIEEELKRLCFQAWPCAKGSDHPQQLMAEILAEQEGVRPYWQEKRQHAWQRLLITLLRGGSAQPQLSPTVEAHTLPDPSGRFPVYLESAAFFLAEHCERSAGIKEVAAFYHVSVDHFTRLFRQRFGYAPKRYQLNARLSRAKHLLQSTSASQQEIAHACGFHDASHFCRFFHKRTGLSPARFRDDAAKR